MRETREETTNLMNRTQNKPRYFNLLSYALQFLNLCYTVQEKWEFKKENAENLFLFLRFIKQN